MSRPTRQVSLIVCTRNRARSLARLLESIRGAELIAGDQLVIVDNGSTDDTAKVAREFKDGAPPELNVITTVEARQGLSRARNRGVAAATHDVVAFTDDDCMVDPRFFTELHVLFTARPNVDFCAGRILRADPEDAEYGCNESQEHVCYEPGTYLPPGALNGSCMAFRRVVLEQIGPFDERIGAGTPWRCEDIDFAERALAHGFRGVRDPNVIVLHAHGRRPGPEVERIIQADDVARGALHAKHALLREEPRSVRTVHRAALRDAAIGVRKPRNRHVVRGAATYLGARIASRVWSIGTGAVGAARRVSG